MFTENDNMNRLKEYEFLKEKHETKQNFFIDIISQIESFEII